VQQSGLLMAGDSLACMASNQAGNGLIKKRGTSWAYGFSPGIPDLPLFEYKKYYLSHNNKPMYIYW